MQPEIDAQLSNFFEETTPREFARVMRGYDPHQVDEYFKQLDGEVRQHREQVQALQQELSDAHRQIREQERPTYAGLGSRIEQLLRLAEEQATEIAQEARSAANELNAAAKVDAAEVRAAAENEAAELRANAKRETDEQRGSAEREADAIKTGARREADELTSTTEREVAKLRATADHEVAEKRAAIERDIAKLRTTTEREVAQLKASAKRERDEILTTSKRQADEMRSQAQRILEESEAQRAQAEAEFEIQLASRREEAERQEAERLSAAQSATQKLVSEAEQRAATAEQRAAKASAQAEQTRREADQHSRQLVGNAKKNADQIVAQAKAQAEQLLADTKSEIERHRASAQREVDELSKQKESISSHLAQISQLLGTQMGGLADALKPGGAGAGRPWAAAPRRRRWARRRAHRPRPLPPRRAAAGPPPRPLRPRRPGRPSPPPLRARPSRPRPSSRSRPRRRPTTTSGGPSRHCPKAERGPALMRRPPLPFRPGRASTVRPARSGQHGQASAVWPPSSTSTWPVMYDDAALARNTAPPAISSGWAQRRIGTVATVAGPAVSSSHRLRFSAVAVQPGHSALTRTPSAAHSTASDLVSEISPALAAPYGARNGAALTPATEATLMTEPVPRSTRCRPAAWQTYMAESRFSRSSLSQPVSRRSRNGTMKLDPPALFTTMSRQPSWSIAVATEAATDACSVTSAGMTNAFRPSAVICAAVSASPSSLRATSARSAPAPASATAITWPIPRDAPVTKAFLPVRSKSGTVSPSTRWAAARREG